MTKPECTRPDCSNPQQARGLCSAHYAKMRRASRRDPDAPRKPRMGRAQRWIEQHKDHKGDDCLIWPFSRSKTGHALLMPTGINRKISSAARLACFDMCSAAYGGIETVFPIKAFAKLGYHVAYTCDGQTSGCMNPRHMHWALGKAKKPSMHWPIAFSVESVARILDLGVALDAVGIYRTLKHDSK